MTTLTIPDDLYQRLAARAAALATTPDALAAEALDQIATPRPARDPSAADTAARLRDFDAMLAGFRALPPAYPPGHEVDVSREAMYAGCGE